MSDQFPVTETTTNALSALTRKAQAPRAPVGTQLQGGYLKFSGKTGRWEMGKEEEDFEGMEVLLHSLSSQHGYIRWGTKPPAKVHTSVLADLPAEIEPFDGVDEKGRPKTHVSQPMRIIMGATFDEHKDAFILELGSMGGVERISELIEAVFVQASKESAANIAAGGDPKAPAEYVFPVIKLSSDFYTRDTGKVYKPIFTILSWRNVDGELPDAVGAEVPKAIVEEAAEAPIKKKRRTAKA